MTGTSSSVGRRIACVVALACLTPGAKAAAQTVVPVHQEPKHRLVLDRFPIRILDVQFMPGDTTLYHRHDAPILYVWMNAPGSNSQTYGQPWRTPSSSSGPRTQLGDISVNVRYPAQPLSHRVTNIGTSKFHLVAVGNNGAGDSAAAALNTAAPTGVAEVDNAFYRAARATLKSGHTTGWARYAVPVVGIQAGPGTLDVEFRDGTRHALTAEGNWFFGEQGTELRIVNSGDSPVAIVLVEVR